MKLLLEAGTDKDVQDYVRPRTGCGGVPARRGGAGGVARLACAAPARLRGILLFPGCLRGLAPLRDGGLFSPLTSG